MSLWDSNVMFLFYEVTDIPRSRSFVENALGLELIENRFHPPHERHGVAKYDAGNVILALNLAIKTFVREASDDVIAVFETDPRREAKIYARLCSEGLSPPSIAGDAFPDHDHHEFAIRSVRPPAGEGEPSSSKIEELHFSVSNIAASVAFYHEVLGLPVLRRTDDRAELETANLKFVLHCGKGSVLPARRDGLLTVFGIPDIEQVYRSLEGRGLDFCNRRVRYSEIGGSVRFLDPDGHNFCLYEPSEESLSWESGPKVRRLLRSNSTPNPSAVVH